MLPFIKSGQSGTTARCLESKDVRFMGHISSYDPNIGVLPPRNRL